jgi:hypothetical protein
MRLLHQTDSKTNLCRVMQVYAIIKDRGAAARPVETVCGKADRQSHAFQSLSNEVEIRLTAVGDFHFVIKYDGKSAPICLYTLVLICFLLYKLKLVRRE